MSRTAKPGSASRSRSVCSYSIRQSRRLAARVPEGAASAAVARKSGPSRTSRATRRTNNRASNHPRPARRPSLPPGGGGSGPLANSAVLTTLHIPRRSRRTTARQAAPVSRGNLYRFFGVEGHGGAGSGCRPHPAAAVGKVFRNYAECRRGISLLGIPAGSIRFRQPTSFGRPGRPDASSSAGGPPPPSR